MPHYSKNAEIFAWMPLLGFDKDKRDKGVGQLVKRMGFTPHAVSVFLCHPDIVHHHDGVKKVRQLPPDNCSYHANPYNEERRRQDWTNKDLKCLADNLRKKGIESYLGIMGIDFFNAHHQEWLYDHIELKAHLRNIKWSLNVLKRFKDGTYYEDFFIDKLCQTLSDYGFDGVHVTDNFCPSGGGCNEFSCDMVGQFYDYLGQDMPDELKALNDESEEHINLRGDWIYKNVRKEWIEFFAWRWEQFWKKICDRLHAIGKKAFVLGSYCTDPFTTLFLKGVDLRRIVNAGVDYLMTNAYANASTMRHAGRPWSYYEHSSICLLIDAHTDKGKKLQMLGVKDVSEEWDVLHHAPTLLERDITYMSGYHRQTEKEYKHSLDGFLVCLSDGIYADEWEWLRQRFDVGFKDSPEKYISPSLVWSDTAHYAILPEYLKTRRYTAHKWMSALDWEGANTGSVVRSENINENSGDLFVPNFDLLSEEEQKFLAAYKGGSVIATASKMGDFSPEKLGINPDIYFEDHDTPFINMAFAYNMDINDKRAILDLVREDDDTPVIEDVTKVNDSINTVSTQLSYQKVSSGFRKALAKLLKNNTEKIFEASHSVIAMKMKDGALRVYVMNNDRLRYAPATITVKNGDIEKVNVVSKFPVLPVKFSDEKVFSFQAQDYPGEEHTFRVLTPQGGVSVVDIYLK